MIPHKLKRYKSISISMGKEIGPSKEILLGSLTKLKKRFRMRWVWNNLLA